MCNETGPKETPNYRNIRLPQILESYAKSVESQHSIDSGFPGVLRRAAQELREASPHRHQNEVDQWIQPHVSGYWSPLEILATLMEETGELAREVNHVYGQKRKKKGEPENNFEAELGDIYFNLICFANLHHISLDDAFRMTMKKCYSRDKDRFEKKTSDPECKCGYPHGPGGE